MPHHRVLSWILPIVLLSLCVASRPVAAQHAEKAEPTWETLEENWYTIEFGGGRAGWMGEIVQTSGDQIRTISETHMKISRMAVPIEVETKTTFTETRDGKALHIESVGKAAKLPMQSKSIFKDDCILETSTQGGSKTVKRHPLPRGDWLTPAAASRYVREQRRAGKREFSFVTIQPDSGLDTVTVTMKRVGAEQYEYDGRQIEVEVWNKITTLTTPVGPMSLNGVEKSTADDVMVFEQTALMGLGDLIMRLSTKEKAQAGDDAPGPEMMIDTFVKPDKPINDSMKAVKAKLRLSVKQGTMPALPAAGAQRVEMSEDGKSAVLTIDINDNLAADEADVANAEYLEASTMVDAGDPLIQKLARGAAERQEGVTQGAVDQLKRAEALRRVAHRRISRKGMETAFASASETAKTQTGDCSEHGVLLCALLRADGIPARVATGLIYIEDFGGANGIFGWHMWTQALIDGKWVDLDATLPVRYSAPHVLTNTSSLSSGLAAGDMMSVIQLIGNLDIQVLDVEYE
jgi:hypothetical protein